MNDTVYRQAAIDAINECHPHCVVPDDYHISIVDAEFRLRKVPPAEPEPCEDVVSRRRLLSDLKGLITAWEKYPVMAEQIKGIKTAIVYVEIIPSITPKEQRWIPVSERLPEEDHWLGGSGKQFSDHVLISILNSDDGDEWVDISQTIDGEWALELPRHCRILTWMPLPDPWKGREA